MTRSFIIFCIVGLIQFFLDLTLFIFLEKIGVYVSIANTISRLTSATLGYILNKKYSFSIENSNSYVMIFRYWIFWLFMTTISSGLITLWLYFFHDMWPVGVGKFTVESFLFFLSYLISKFWVYKDVEK